MTKEFNLSEKISGCYCGECGREIGTEFSKKDVKEFIKRLKGRIFSPIFDSSIKPQDQIEDELIAEIDKLAGDDLND